MIKIYTKNNCMPCKMTKNLFDKFGIAYEEINIEENEKARTYVSEVLGYKTAPVVVTENDNWAGFNPNNIRGLLEK